MLFGRRKKNRILPEITLQEIWEAFNEKPSEKSDSDHQSVIRKINHFEPDAREGILNDLLQIETESMRQNDRLRYVREKIMDLVDRRAAATSLRRIAGRKNHSEVEADDASNSRLELALADCDIQITILRAYTKAKYGDEGPDDWYCMYSYLSDFFNNRLVTSATDASRQSFLFEGQSLDPTKDNFQHCRNKCLDAYIGRSFNLPNDNSNQMLKFWRKFVRWPIWRKLVS